jgi:hypothetical protein
MSVKVYLLACTLLVLPGSAEAECLKANKADVPLEGRLMIGRVKNYERKMSQVFILDLAKPICLDGEGEYDKVDDTRQVHVFSLKEPMLRRLRGLAGKTVRVEGRPFGQVSYHHHHAPIVMEVARVERR